jgi:exodeoxyribonuclease VII large subunit
VQNDRQRLDVLQERIGRALISIGQLRRARIDGLQNRLQALNPMAVLQRGYAVVRGPDGRPVSRIAQVHVGDQVTVRLSDGTFEANVKQVNPAKEKDR